MRNVLRFTDVYAVSGVVNTSDERQKRDIQSTDLGLEFINQLEPVSYRWREGKDSSQHYGLIAQKTEQVIQDAKAKSGDTSKEAPGIVSYDSTSDRYGIRYNELISPIIKAIQELYSSLMGTQADVATLKAENAAKTREIASIKAKVDRVEQENAQLKATAEKQKQENAAKAKELEAIKAYICSKDPKAAICK